MQNYACLHCTVLHNEVGPIGLRFRELPIKGAGFWRVCRPSWWWCSCPDKMWSGAHFSKIGIHISYSFQWSHLASGNCEMWFSFHISQITFYTKRYEDKNVRYAWKWEIWNVKLQIRYEKCEVRVYIFGWVICEVWNVKFCVQRELNFSKNGLQICNVN